MRTRPRSNRTCLLEPRGFVLCTGPHATFETKMQTLFDAFPPHASRRLRHVPQFIGGYRPEFAAALTVVFCPITGKIWYKLDRVDLSAPPFCFRDMTRLARTYERLALAGR